MKRCHFFHILAASMLVDLAGTCSVFALQVDDFSTSENDRFTNSSSFIMNDYDLSGVGRSSNDRWATLVSPNVILSAYHYAPSGTVTFHLTNDPYGTSVTRRVSSGQRLGTTDIWMGVLQAPVPGDFAVYDFATENIGNARAFGRSSYYGENAYLVGRSPNYSGVTDVSVGRNILDGWEDGIDVSGTVDDAMLAVVEDEGQDVPYEALLQGGDSGGPMFVDRNNDQNLTFVGTNWFIGTTAADEPVNGFTYLGNYDTEIQSYIDAHPATNPAVDFNGNGYVDLADVNALTDQGDVVVGMPVPPADAKYDLNSDSTVNSTDLTQWLADAATVNGYASAYLACDVNLDRLVDIDDLNTVLSHFYPLTDPTAVFGDGDTNGDEQIDVTDLNRILTDFTPVAYGAESELMQTALTLNEAEPAAESEDGSANILVNTVTGEIVLVGDNVDLSIPQIVSGSGGLVVDEDGAALLDASASTTTYYLEFLGLGEADVNVDGLISLGRLYDTTRGATDLTFKYAALGGSAFQGGVIYIVPEPTTLALFTLGGLAIVRRSSRSVTRRSAASRRVP